MKTTSNNRLLLFLLSLQWWSFSNAWVIATPTRRRSTHLPATLRRIKDSVTSKEYTRDELKLGIAGFYDRSSQLWERVWGEHMHHVRMDDRVVLVEWAL